MPFPMKIQPIDSHTSEELNRNEAVKPVVKSRFKRLFERQFPSVLRISAAEKPGGVGEPHCNKDGSGEFEPSSVCLAKMVQSFMEESNEKQSAAVRCGRNRCNCFNGNCSDTSDDELETFDSLSDSNPLNSSGEACEVLKSLIPCANLFERNLLADTAKIVEKNKINKRKDNYCRQIVADGLLAIGYDDVSVCKTRWDKSPSYPAGEYEYVDVIVDGERLLIDIDFRSEFEMARSTKTYKALTQTLPYTFVGKADRLQKIISVVSEAAKQSLKKKGMHFPPWRKAEYVKAKWLSPYTRTTPTPTPTSPHSIHLKTETNQPLVKSSSAGEFDLIFGERASPGETDPGDDSLFTLSESSGEEEKTTVVKQWEPPEIKPKPKPKNQNNGVKILTGLASVIEEKP